ncbi:MAG: hypothetical protein KKF62_05005 [Bacteroidetes bacterium]|nr:hypothetical protein [Bacteroidota bacterium]MBU1114287.1 hypothetical protein [Bacteroidota bacterium]MBU1799402.1 hypothetical protein [Bacteroidota bacterium]
MKKTIIILLLSALLIGCNNSDKEEVKPDKNKQLLDSLMIEKEAKSSEINSLNSELDSLKKIKDSLESISK